MGSILFEQMFTREVNINFDFDGFHIAQQKQQNYDISSITIHQ